MDAPYPEHRDLPRRAAALEEENDLLRAEIRSTRETYVAMQAEIDYFRRKSAKAAVEAAEAHQAVRRAEEDLDSQANLVAQLKEANNRLRKAREVEPARTAKETWKMREWLLLQKGIQAIASGDPGRHALGSIEELERTGNKQQAAFSAPRVEAASVKDEPDVDQLSISPLASRVKQLEAENKRLRHAKEKLAQENAAFRTVLAKKTADRLFSTKPMPKDGDGDDLPAMSRAIERYRRRRAHTGEEFDVPAEQLMEENTALILYIRRVLTRMAGFTNQDILTPRGSMESIGRANLNTQSSISAGSPTAGMFSVSPIFGNGGGRRLHSGSTSPFRQLGQSHGPSPRPTSPLAMRSDLKMAPKVPCDCRDDGVSKRTSVASSFASSAPLDGFRKRPSGASVAPHAVLSCISGQTASSQSPTASMQHSAMDNSARRRASSTGTLRRALSRVGFWSTCTREKSSSDVNKVAKAQNRGNKTFQSL